MCEVTKVNAVIPLAELQWGRLDHVDKVTCYDEFAAIGRLTQR